MNDELDQFDLRTLRKLKRIARDSEPKRGILGAAVWRTIQRWLDELVDQAEQTQVKRDLVNINVYPGEGQSAEDLADKVQRSLLWTTRNYS